MAKLADALDLGSSAARRVGSTPSIRTEKGPNLGPFSVRMEGVDPTRLAALDPKSSACTNFATSA